MALTIILWSKKLISFISIIKIIIWFLFVPFCLGLSANKVFGKDGISIPLSMVFGFAVMLAVFQVFAVPMVAFSTPFHVLKNVWMAAVILLAVISVAMNKEMLTDKNFLILRKADTDNFTKIVFAIAVAIIIFQTWLLAFNMHTDTDDVRFISEALEACERDSMLKLHPISGVTLDSVRGELTKELASPYPFFIATIAKIINVHPAVTAHVLFPIVLIPLCYGVMYVIGNYFFDEKKRVAVYMLLLSVILLFSFESIYALGYTLLTIIWQGRSIAATIMFPVLWYVLMRIYTDEKVNAWFFVWLLTVLLACADLSGMGIIMSISLCLAYAGALVIKRTAISRLILMILTMIPNIIYFLYYAVSSK